ncbi:Nif3-like dinuclear metal center hexameric protein [bacterium]|nr:Nif3-like dinuclear metal center hexameric protein [bacterium]
MYKYEITKKIEQFAPIETQEDWDCSGWAVNIENYDEINKLMLCLTVTNDVVKQAKEQNCDMIISHHPLFHIDCHSELVSESYTPQINVYCAHTNMDKAQGGTTDTIIDKLRLSEYKTNIEHEFLRIIDYNTTIQDFSRLLKQISPNARIINNNQITELKKIAFCAGSGSEFIQDAKELGADCLVTGDLKFHTALESPIVIYDIGHFESEILILPVFEKIIGNYVKIVYADEHSPFELI